MYIYNITIKPDWKIHDEWLHWMKEIYLPDIINTNCFTEYRIVKLLEMDESDGPTYAVQLFAENIAEYNRYQQVFEDNFNKMSNSKWGDRFISFASLMQIVH